MRPYHSSKHKHLSRSNIMNVLGHYSPRPKKYILHFIIQIIIRMAGITHVPHLFSMKHIFLEVNTASLSIQKEERKKKMGVCVPQPSTLGPHLVVPRPLKYCKNKFMNKAYYLFKIILIQD